MYLSYLYANDFNHRDRHNKRRIHNSSSTTRSLFRNKRIFQVTTAIQPAIAQEDLAGSSLDNMPVALMWRENNGRKTYYQFNLTDNCERETLILISLVVCPSSVAGLSSQPVSQSLGHNKTTCSCPAFVCSPSSDSVSFNYLKFILGIRESCCLSLEPLPSSPHIQKRLVITTVRSLWRNQEHSSHHQTLVVLFSQLFRRVFYVQFNFHLNQIPATLCYVWVLTLSFD